jgi:hypothetical protein
VTSHAEQLHGYEPGTAKPTTSMVLSHKHPEDYEQVVATGPPLIPWGLQL